MRLRISATRCISAARSGTLLQGLTIATQADSLAERLSYGQQKLLSLGRLLAGKAELLGYQVEHAGSFAMLSTSFASPTLLLALTSTASPG